MILGRLRRSAKPEALGVPGYRVYAIGDVHGRLDLLDGLLDQIKEDHGARGGNVQPVLVFLGDLIDRGPDFSRGVVERVLTGPLDGFQTIVLAGNHEEVLLRLLEGEGSLLGHWLSFGGVECLASYSLDASRLEALPESAAVDLLRRTIPQEHQQYLASLADSFTFGDYLFVHAGIRPGLPLAKQSPIDLRWIRQPFLSDRRDHGVMVVHGHTITETVDERPNRIGIDTGSYHFGRLTALGIEGGQRWFLQQEEADLAKRGPLTERAI